MNTRRPLLFLLCLLAVALSLLPYGVCDIGDGVTIGDGFGGDVLPTPVGPARSIGLNLIGNLGLFAILPVAVGAFVFFIALKGFGQNTDGEREAIIPALITAIVIVVMTEICVYVTVYIVNVMSG